MKKMLKYGALALVLLSVPVALVAMEKIEKKNEKEKDEKEKTNDLIKKAKLELAEEKKEKEWEQTQRLISIVRLIIYNKDLPDEQKVNLIQRSLIVKPKSSIDLARGIMDDAALGKEKKTELLKNFLSLDWIKKNADSLFENTWLDDARFLWRLGYLTQTREALEKGKFVTTLTLKLSNSSTFTPAHIAAAMGKVKETQYFRRKGCNTNYTVKIPTQNECDSLTATDIAASRGKVRTTSYLLRHEGKSNRDSDMISVVTAFHKLLASRLPFDSFINTYFTISNEAVASTGVPGKTEDLNRNIAWVKKLLYLDKSKKIANAFIDWDKKRGGILNTMVNILSTSNDTKNNLCENKDAQPKVITNILNNPTNNSILTKTLNVISYINPLHNPPPAKNKK